jgi:hypothetical protein
VNRRTRIVTLSALGLALGLGLAVLSRREATETRVTTPAGKGDPLAPVVRRLTAELAASPSSDLADAWVVVRALGPRAPSQARERVAEAFSTSDFAGPLPRWAGSDPALALAATLLETGIRSEGRATPLDGHLATARTAASDPFTLSWRIEYLALLLRAKQGEASLGDLRRQLHGGLKWLERGLDPSSLEYAWLARAVFKAAALGVDGNQRAALQRAFARLLATPRAPSASVELFATQLEAIASYALSQQGQGDPSLVVHRTVAQDRTTLAQRSKRPGTSTASASLRALRLSWAALRDTNSVFTQYGETTPGPAQ